MIREILSKSVLRRYIVVASVAGVLVLGGAVWAAASLIITPSTGLVSGQKISVSGSGFADSSIGAVVECNSDPTQPTVTVAGNAVPVSCSNPLSVLVTTSKTGVLPVTSFTIKGGTVGPPGTGTDSSGGSAATDAANYPCPPTAAQLAAGDSCTISFGDSSGDDVAQNITFASQTPPTTTPPATPPAPQTPSSTSSTPSSSASSSTTTLVNTGPGDTIGLFALVAIVGSTAHYIFVQRRRNRILHANN